MKIRIFALARLERNRLAKFSSKTKFNNFGKERKLKVKEVKHTMQVSNYFNDYFNAGEICTKTRRICYGDSRKCLKQISLSF